MKNEKTARLDRDYQYQLLLDIERIAKEIIPPNVLQFYLLPSFLTNQLFDIRDTIEMQRTPGKPITYFPLGSQPMPSFWKSDQ